MQEHGPQHRGLELPRGLAWSEQERRRARESTGKKKKKERWAERRRRWKVVLDKGL